VKLSEEALRKILNPAPGSALARARRYSIDLTLIAHNIRLTPKELLENAVWSEIIVRTLAEMRENRRRPTCDDEGSD
jgi:hypothetical protein